MEDAPPDDDGRSGAVAVDLADLSPEALRGVVEAFVNREGTDYGAVERSFEDKVADVMRQLRRGEALVVFDPETHSVDVVTGREWREGRRR